MKHKNFRDFKIVRSCTKVYKRYQSYRHFLRTDFNERCAYCNLKETAVTTSFEIDHFIPRNIFKDIRDELDSNYNNLMFTCKKCNDAKSDQFQGDVHSEKIDNEMFYNPVEIDFNNIFFRNEFGAIDSDDAKGRDMINRLKLYRPIHNLAWLCEELLNTRDKIKRKIIISNDEKQKAFLGQALNKIDDYYIECNKIFLANYNNNDFKI